MNTRDCRSIAGCLLALICLLPSSAIAQTEIPNGDFEDLYNPLASWNTHGQVSVVQDLRDAYSFPAGFGDGNEDNNVDILDLIALQLCFTGFDEEISPGSPCLAYSLNQIDKIDVYDFAAFLLKLADGLGHNSVMLLQESSNGSVSRAYISLADLSDTNQLLSFRYRFARYGDPTNSKVPPDSFEVFLTNEECTDRLILSDSDDPNFDMFTFEDLSFFYEDTDPNQPYDPNNPGNPNDALVFADNYVTVSDTDALGYRTVVLDLTSLFSGPIDARLEFGLANANNGVTSYVAIDDVTLGCPEGYCCGASGLPVPKPDGSPCALYECDPNGPTWNEVGTTNECCTGCFTGPTQPYDVLFMVDNSGSTSQTDLDNSIAAIIQLLDDWEAAYSQYPNSVILPRVAIGRFPSLPKKTICGVPDQLGHEFVTLDSQGQQQCEFLPTASIDLPAATLPTDPGFTTDYDMLRANLSMDFQLNAGTSISDALHVSLRLFQLYADQSHRQAVVLFTDGWTSGWTRELYSLGNTTLYQPMLSDTTERCWNHWSLDCTDPNDPNITIPGRCCNCDPNDPTCFDGPDYCWCHCVPAQLATEVEARWLEEAGVEVFPVHYVGTGGDAEDQCRNVDDAVNFLLTQVATTPLHLLTAGTTGGSDDLGCLFEKLRGRFACGDDNPCTIDLCDDEGECVHLEIGGCTTIE